MAEKQMIHEKIIAILSDADAIAKDRRNQQQGFSFRGIDDVYNALHPILAKHGVFSTTQVIAERTEERQAKSGGNLIYRILTVKFTFYAADGSHVESVIIGEGMDSGDKASNKAMAIAHKYALLQLLAIPTEDAKDPDAETHQVAPKQKPAPLDEHHPVGNPPIDGLKQRARDIQKALNMPDDVYIAILCAHGAKIVNGKVDPTLCDYGAVVNELKERQRNAIDPNAEAQISKLFDGVTA